MNETQENAMLECARILARAGFATATITCRNQALERMPVAIMLSPGVAKCAAIGFAHEAGPREYLTLDTPESEDLQSLTE